MSRENRLCMGDLVRPAGNLELVFFGGIMSLHMYREAPWLRGAALGKEGQALWHARKTSTALVTECHQSGYVHIVPTGGAPAWIFEAWIEKIN